MALNNISFVLGQGGLGRPLPGEDYISALIFYTSGSLPSGYSSSNPVKQFFSVADAESAGILSNFNDETAATATYLVTTAGATGDTITLNVADPYNGSITLGTY